MMINFSSVDLAKNVGSFSAINFIMEAISDFSAWKSIFLDSKSLRYSLYDPPTKDKSFTYLSPKAIKCWSKDWFDTCTCRR